MSTDVRRTCGSLFSGVGGLDLGLERAGWQIVWQVELEDFCQRVLAAHWPAVTRYRDIRSLDVRALARVELLCGGFPCQPVSVAGKRRGQADERWLWPEFARVIRAVRPRFVLVENVPGLLQRGIGDVLGDLAACGYDAEWDCLPAASAGAPHLRDRVWIVAYPERADVRVESGGLDGARGSDAAVARNDGASRALADPEVDPLGARLRASDPLEVGERRSRDGRREDDDDRQRALPYADDGRREVIGLAQSDGLTGSRRHLTHGLRALREQQHAQTARALARVDRSQGFFAQGATEAATIGDGQWWAVEPDMGRVAHGVPQRVDRLRTLGAAVVPHVAEWIGRRLIAR